MPNNLQDMVKGSQCFLTLCRVSRAMDCDVIQVVARIGHWLMLMPLKSKEAWGSTHVL